MDTKMHADAIPDADPATLKRPRDAARDVIAAIDAAWPTRAVPPPEMRQPDTDLSALERAGAKRAAA
jgi:hypothetical protein